ncbi:MAG: dihydroorotase [Cyanobacteria bacterium J06632_3]
MSQTQPIIIQGAKVLLPSGDIEHREIAIADGKITAVGTALAVAANAKTIDGRGLTVLPGVIDSQVSFGDDNLLTATCACAKGGVTSFLEMPNPLSPTTTQANLTDKLAIAATKSLVNYGFFIGATPQNLPDLREATPTCGIKLSMAPEPTTSDSGALSVQTPETIEPIFSVGDRLIAMHAEDASRTLERRQLFANETNPATHSKIHDHEAALSATQFALSLSKKYQRRLHILHLSTGDEAELLRRDKPSWVTVEVTPQHLLLDVSTYETLGTLAQTEPSLKYPRDRELLWQALLDGIIDLISTSHTPVSLDAKDQGFPNAPSGMPGVETVLPLMLTQAKGNRCTVAQVSHWLSTAVAQAYKIPNKGLIEPGYDADLVLVDLTTYRPVHRNELKTNCGWSPFEGWALTGWPVVTLVGGQIAYDRGDIDIQVRGKALSFG